MTDVLVRNIDKVVIQKLKARATEHHRSLQSELKEILEQAARHVSMSDAKKAALRIQRGMRGRQFTDGAVLLAEDRER